MEVLQWASSTARRRVAWVYEGTCLYSPLREVYIGSPPLGFTYLNRFGYNFGNRSNLDRLGLSTRLGLQLPVAWYLAGLRSTRRSAGPLASLWASRKRPAEYTPVGVSPSQTTNATRGLPCSPMNLTPTGSIHLPLYRQPSRWKPAPLQQVWGTHPQLNWRLPNSSKLTRQIKDKLVRTKSKLGFPMKH